MRRLAFIVMLALALPLYAQEADSTVVALADSTVVASADSVLIQDVLPDKSMKADSAALQPEPEAPKPVKKDSIYQATLVRVDIFNPIFDALRSDWHTYSVEAAVSVRLKNRFFPTVEFGHAGQFLQQKVDRSKNLPDSLYHGSGQFARIGLDINPLKKRPDQRSSLLIGVRLGTGWQRLDTPDLKPYFPKGEWIADVWGEVAAGVNVDIMYGVYMGWAVRMKFLFTKNSHDELTTPYYIPGFGYHNNMNWGFDYYIGYAF